MNPELENKLYTKYPKLFAQKDLGIQQSPMAWGCQCDDGWFDLIDNLCNFLQTSIDISHKFNNKKITQLEFSTIKEKFATLRIYTSNIDETNEDLLKVINFVEFLSTQTCEICGSKNARTIGRYWLKTLCDNCSKEYKN